MYSGECGPRSRISFSRSPLLARSFALRAVEERMTFSFVDLVESKSALPFEEDLPAAEMRTTLSVVLEVDEDEDGTSMMVALLRQASNAATPARTPDIAAPIRSRGWDVRLSISFAVSWDTAADKPAAPS